MKSERKLKIIYELDVKKFNKEVNDFLKDQDRIMKTEYTIKDEMYYAFIEYLEKVSEDEGK